MKRQIFLLLLGTTSACSGEDECSLDTSYAPLIDPASFVATVAKSP